MKRTGNGRPATGWRRAGIAAMASLGMVATTATAAQATGPGPFGPGFPFGPAAAADGGPGGIGSGGADGPDLLPGPGMLPEAPGLPALPGPGALPPGLRVPDAGTPPKPASGTPKTYRVYATREGLVGHTTANGHKVVTNDHFVSLPSTISLSAKGKNYYSVRVCSVTNGRCAYEPVWDVGPWNTHDDYWDAHRASWTSLEQGLPEAQAAYQDGYNHGEDQFGRTVLNPAGIDLADGTIRDGLDIGGSGWVNVTYLWTGGGIRASISTDGGVVNVRGGDSTTHEIVGLAGPYAQIPISCGINVHLHVVPAAEGQLRLSGVRLHAVQDAADLLRRRSSPSS
jgi:hypothetical protein